MTCLRPTTQSSGLGLDLSKTHGLQHSHFVTLSSLMTSLYFMPTIVSVSLFLSFLIPQLLFWGLNAVHNIFDLPDRTDMIWSFKNAEGNISGTYIAWVEWKWNIVLVQCQSRRRFSGAQLIQFLLQNKPLCLQLGSHALRQSNLLPALLQCMSLAELVDPGQNREQLCVRNGKFLVSVSTTRDEQLNKTSQTTQLDGKRAQRHQF